MNNSNLKISQRLYHNADKVELIRGGKLFFDVLDNLIREAKSEIHVQVYILEEDETGLRVVKALCDAAIRGVEVYLVLDKYASSNLSAELINKIIDSGIRFKWFKPVIRFGNMEFGRRMHHKIVSIDESVALSTGINFANRYNDIGDQQAWLDFAILVEGISAVEIKRRCLQIWESPFKLKKYKKFRLPVIQKAIKADNILVKVSVNDWLRGKQGIHKGYNSAFKNSNSEILIVGGYFLPGRLMRNRIRDAARRGVQVKVILTHISDVAFAKEASEFLYSWMFRNNIEIYEWQPTILHGKIAIVDKMWATVGSYNLNYLSTFESLELNLEIIDAQFAASLSQLFHKITENECIQITEENYLKHYSIIKSIKNWFSFWFARNSMRILNAFSNKPKPS